MAHTQEPEPPRPPGFLLVNPLTLLEPLERYIQEVKRITGLEAVSVDEKMARIRDVGRELSREMGEHYAVFARQLDNRRRELLGILSEPRPDPGGDLRRLLGEMRAVVEKFELREGLTRGWFAEASAEILRAYERSLATGDTAALELFEAYAEDFLALKGDPTSLAAFRARREEARQSRLTPAQLRAQEELREIERLEAAMRLMESAIQSIVAKVEPGPRDDPAPRD